MQSVPDGDILQNGEAWIDSYSHVVVQAGKLYDFVSVKAKEANGHKVPSGMIP
ncbi:MAG TPA: hypothetical protein GX717_08965 [Clostridiaceae bacterium]|nr:hypothetical protein [Clostridiaceae bacterium]